MLSLLIVLSLFFLGFHRPTYVWRILGCFQDIPGNFWLHRVNSPLKMKEFAEKYNGFEMDVSITRKTEVLITLMMQARGISLYLKH